MVSNVQVAFVLEQNMTGFKLAVPYLGFRRLEFYPSDWLIQRWETHGQPLKFLLVHDQVDHFDQKLGIHKTWQGAIGVSLALFHSG